SVLAGGEYENEHHGDECRADQQRTLRHAEYHSRSFILAQHIHGRRTRPPRTTTPASNMPGGEETGGKEIHPMGPAPPGMHYSAYSDCDCSLAPGERTQPWLIRAARLVSNAARNSSVVWWLWSPSTNSARSLVILPLSTVSMTTCSSCCAKSTSSVLPSSLPRCSNPRVQAKMEAIGLVEVDSPCWCLR